VDGGCVAPEKMAGLLDETRQLIAIFTTIDKNSERNPQPLALNVPSAFSLSRVALDMTTSAFNL
jgi:hypothetical protein